MVANAAILSMASIVDLTVDDWDNHLAVNARSVMLCFKYAAREMIKQGRGGRIIGKCSDWERSRTLIGLALDIPRDWLDRFEAWYFLTLKQTRSLYPLIPSRLSPQDSLTLLHMLPRSLQYADWPSAQVRYAGLPQ